MCQALSDIALSSDSSAFHCVLQPCAAPPAAWSSVWKLDNIKRRCHVALRNAAGLKCYIVDYHEMFSCTADMTKKVWNRLAAVVMSVSGPQTDTEQSAWPMAVCNPCICLSFAKPWTGPTASAGKPCPKGSLCLVRLPMKGQTPCTSLVRLSMAGLVGMPSFPGVLDGPSLYT